MRLKFGGGRLLRIAPCGVIAFNRCHRVMTYRTVTAILAVLSTAFCAAQEVPLAAGGFGHPYHKTKAYAQAIGWKPDVVVIRLGTNDNKHPSPEGGKGSNYWRCKAEFGFDAHQLVDEFDAANPKVEVFVCLPVPAFPGGWNIDGKAVKEEIIPILKEVDKTSRCLLIDLYSALESHKKLFPDTVHPNASGATVIVRTAF
ncbi:MAG: GDSL-type esterase/lipase family protein [Akkermansiaceae bacterium]